VSQTLEHLLRHWIRWRDHQTELRNVVRKATGWKACRFRHVQISELFSIEECDQAVMDFLVATEVTMFLPKVKSGFRAWGSEATEVVAGFDLSVFLSFFLVVFLSVYLSFVNGDEG